MAYTCMNSVTAEPTHGAGVSATLEALMKGRPYKDNHHCCRHNNTSGKIFAKTNHEFPGKCKLTWFSAGYYYNSMRSVCVCECV